MLRHFLAVTLVSIFVPLTASAQQTYEIKPTFNLGEKWTTKRINTYEMTTTVKVQQQVMEQSQQRSIDTADMVWEVLVLENGMPTAARVSFKPECGTELQQNGQTQRLPFPAAGVTIEARRRGDDVDISPPTANTPEVISVLEQILEPDLGSFPTKPLAVGESWSWNRESVAQTFGLAPDDKGSVTCTINSVNTENARQVADITMTIKLEQGQSQEQPGQRVATLTETNMQGRGRMDIAAGRLIQLDLNGNIVVSGIIYGPDDYGNLTPQADLDGQGRISIKSSSRPINSTSPLNDVQGAATLAVDYVGEFSNEHMTLVLARSDKGYSGELRSAAASYPVRAQQVGNNLKGSFQSDDHWFDFTATLSGTTLTFTTGNASHSLKKKAIPANPFSKPQVEQPPAQTQPTNPFAAPSADNRPSGRGNAADYHQADSTSSLATRYRTFRCLDERGLRDAAGMPLEVFRMLIPNDWQFTGGVEWKINHQDVTTMSRVDLVNPVVLSFAVSSNDGSVALQSYPEVHFADLTGSPAQQMGAFPTGSNYAGFTVCPVMDPASYITQFVIPQQRGLQYGAEIVESKPLPALALRYDREAAIVNNALAGALGGSVSHRAAMVTVDYDNHGRPYREVFVVTLGYLQTPGITMWSSRLNLSMRAPREEVDRWQPVVATMLNSVQFNMRWIGKLLSIQKKAEGVIVDVDRFCQKVDAEITANRAETNAQIQRDMYPRLAPFCDHVGADGNHYFLETDKQHQMNAQGVIRSGNTLPDEEGWTRMPEYTGT